MASGSAVVRFDALPEPVLRVIMLELPVDERARAACVCRGWRAFLSDVSLWQVLDLTLADGVAAERVTENLVRGAVARAAGGLRSVRFTYMPLLDVHTLCAALGPGGAELQQVNIDRQMRVRELHDLFAAAPRLQVLNADVEGQCTALLPVLRNVPPYGPLRVSNLEVQGRQQEEADVLAFAAAVASHESLKGLSLLRMNSARGLNAMVDAAAERRVSLLSLNENCEMDADFVPALARLLQRGSLTKLVIGGGGFPHAPEAGVTELCAALRACRMLTHLDVCLSPPGDANISTVTELLEAIASLPALSLLDKWGSQVQNKAHFGQALGALLATNLPNLRILRVGHCGLGDEGVAPLLDDLVANTHLHKLNCENSGLSDAFYNDRLLPALAALAARAELDA